MPRLKLIFDQGFGIANCWYPLDSSMHETVSNLTRDLLLRFGVKDLVLEMDGYIFLEDGLTRLLFKDNDEISVKSVANKRVATAQDDCRKKIKLETKLPVALSLDVGDLVDSADEYESSLDLEDESETLINSAAMLTESVQEKDDHSFHLSVNATSAIQDQDSSDASSVSLADVEMGSIDDQVLKKDSSTIGKEPSGKDDSVDTKETSREYEKSESSKDTGDKNVYFEDKGNAQLAKERFVYYDGGKPEDMTIVMKKTKGKFIVLILDDDGKSKCFYGFNSYYLKAGESTNTLKFRKNISSNSIDLNTDERTCRDKLHSVGSNSKDSNKCQVANEIDDLGDRKVEASSRVRVVLRKNAEPLIPALPSFPVLNYHGTESNQATTKQKIIPAFPVPPIITGQKVAFQPPRELVLPVPPTIKSYRSENNGKNTKQINSGLVQPLPEIEAKVSLDNEGGKSVKWGVNDSFFDQNKKHSDSQPKGRSKSAIEREDFSKKSLNDQYKCFIDLAKYCEKFGPDEWIPGNIFISQHQNFYLKYGQQRWKTYLEWGRKLRLLDYKLIKSEIHVRMSLLMRRMIINLSDSPSGELSTGH
jgi:hypothetical protein